MEEDIVSKYDENSRDPSGRRVEFISCKSPAAKAWAEENKAGKLITEVGFFGKHRKYFIRPRNEDPVDEMSVFDKKIYSFDYPLANTETFWAELMNAALPVISEPDFGREYFEEMSDYLFYGTNLNPYIDETAVLDKGALKLDIPRNNEEKSRLASLFKLQNRH